MTTPVPSTEDRLTALERAVAGLIQEAGLLRDRHASLEQRMAEGLEELKARRPPVRRRLEELEAALADVLPPPAEEPPAAAPPTQTETKR